MRCEWCRRRFPCLRPPCHPCFGRHRHRSGGKFSPHKYILRNRPAAAATPATPTPTSPPLRGPIVSIGVVHQSSYRFALMENKMAHNDTPHFLFETSERVIRIQFVLTWHHLPDLPVPRFFASAKVPSPPPSQGNPHCHRRRDQAAPLLPPSPPPLPRSLAPTSAIPSLGALQMFGHSAIFNKPSISMSFFNAAGGGNLQEI